MGSALVAELFLVPRQTTGKKYFLTGQFLIDLVYRVCSASSPTVFPLDTSSYFYEYAA